MSKKLLYLTTRFPYPVVGGDKVRMYNTLKQLKTLGYEITLVSLVTEDDNLDSVKEHTEFYSKLIPVKFNKNLAYLNAVKAIFNDKPFIVEYFYSKDMQRIVDELLKKEHFDIITGYMIRIAPYLEKHQEKNIIIDFVDAVSMMYWRRIKNVNSLWDKLKIGFEYLKVKKYEKKCAEIFKHQTVISKFDKDYIERFASKSKISIIGNGVDTEYFYPIKSQKSNEICFVGSMQYIPNSEAAIYFATKIFPLIKTEIPDAKFKIIGANPRQELYEATKNIIGVEITGKVDDVREYMKDCLVSVCPVHIAGGVQNKILEAMSMGIPVVTTPEGFEGINADKSVLQLANNNEEYAKKVIEIIKNPELHDYISNKSRDFIIKNFAWKKVGEELNNLINEVYND